MTVTENVINDLLPAYLSGEASEDTIALVESYLSKHPELKKQLSEISIPQTVHEPVDFDLQLMERTKKMIKYRSLCFGFALFFSCLPFTFADISGDNRGVFWLWESFQLGAYLSGFIALMLWLIYIRIQKNLRVVGL